MTEGILEMTPEGRMIYANRGPLLINLPKMIFGFQFY